MNILNSPIAMLMVAFLALAAIQGVRAWLGYREVRADARSDHTFRAAEGMSGSELAYERYERAYLRAHAPRAALYRAIGFAALALVTFPALRIADLVMTLVWRLSGGDRTFEPTFLVYQFGVFFMLIGLWALTAYLVARRYHRGTSAGFEQELRRERGLL